jgi:hypothetical protein
MMKQEVSQDFWDNLLLKLRRLNAQLKAIPKPAKTMDERRVTALLAKAKEKDEKLKGRDCRKGKLRHGGVPHNEFIENQMALDEEKYNSPAYKAIVSGVWDKGMPKPASFIASSEEE